MDQNNFPALFGSADDASNREQALYLWLVRAEYGALFLAAIFSMPLFSGQTFYTIYAFLFIVLIAILLTRAFRRPEQDWYRCRALAESVKTLSWRYMMRAAPFEDGIAPFPREVFRNHLRRLFDANRAAAEKISPDWAAQAQISAQMDHTRDLDLPARKAIYALERIQDQRMWYVRKAKANRKSLWKWVLVGVGAYAAGAALVLSRIRFPNWTEWPIEPVLVFAASVIGWVQIKKFSELGAAYTVTAHEIGLILPTTEAANSEQELSDAVNEAELAFSREHTLWIARQTN